MSEYRPIAMIDSDEKVIRDDNLIYNATVAQNNRRGETYDKQHWKGCQK